MKEKIEEALKALGRHYKQTAEILSLLIMKMVLLKCV